MYSEKNLAKSLDFGKNGVNKSVSTIDHPRYKPMNSRFQAAVIQSAGS
jgi:hypothetical protein